MNISNVGFASVHQFDLQHGSHQKSHVLWKLVTNYTLKIARVSIISKLFLKFKKILHKKPIPAHPDKIYFVEIEIWNYCNKFFFSNKFYF